MKDLLDSGLAVYLMGAVLLIAVLYIMVVKNLETRRVLSRFNEKDILLMSFGVFFYGTEKTFKKPKYIPGVMVLTKNELFFQRRILSFSFSIPLSSLRAVGVSDMFMEKPAYGNILVFTYDNPEKGTDKAGFKIPQPDRWLAGIQTFLKT